MMTEIDPSFLLPYEYEVAIRGSHQEFSRVMLTLDGSIVDDTFHGGGIVGLDAERSGLTFDRFSEARTTGSITFVGRSPLAREYLNPLRKVEVLPFHGTGYFGEIYWRQLGVLRITDVDTSDSGGNVLYTCQCSDRSFVVKDNGWREPFQIAAGLTYSTAANLIMADRVTALSGFHPYEFAISNGIGGTTPLTNYASGEDPWSAIMALAEGDGCETYFDDWGVWHFDPIPDPMEERPYLTLDSDNYDVVIGPLHSRVSRREVVNGVICRGSAPWLLFPIGGEVWDDDPLSPTNRTDFGEKPFKIDSAIATSNAQCDAIAAAEYKKRKGVTEEINFGMIKDPRVKVGCVIMKLNPDGGQATPYVLDQLDFPMGSGVMSGLVRRKF